MTVQIENGYTKIANELLDALCAIRISGEQRQCLDFIIRKTYGFNKKEDRIANSQFCRATGLKKPTVCRSIKALVDRKIVIKNDNSIVPSYCFNKNYNEWVVLSKKITVIKNDNGVIKNDNKALSKMIPTKDNTKDNITKEKEKPDWFDENLFNDFLDMRRKIKAPMTERAITLIINKISALKEKGHSPRLLLEKAIVNNWKSVFEGKDTREGGAWR